MIRTVNTVAPYTLIKYSGFANGHGGRNWTERVQKFTTASGLQKWLVRQTASPMAAAAAATGQGINSRLPPRSNRAATCPTRKQSRYVRPRMLVARMSSVQDLARANRSTRIDP